MDLSIVVLPPALALVLDLLAFGMVVAVARATDWRRLAGIERINAWLLTAAFLAMIWAIRAEVSSGLNLHLSGATFFALVYGWRLAILGMTLVCLAMAVAGHILPINLGAQFLIAVVLPVSFAYGLLLLCEALLPRNFFVYVFGPAFFGAWLTTAVVALATTALLWGFGAYTFSELNDAFLPYFLILGFSEGFITGFVLTLLVVYKPDWVYTFRDERYIRGR